MLTACKAQTIPSTTETIKAMELANAYFMNKWPDAGKTIVTNRERPSNIWTRAVYYEGLMALYAIDKNKTLLTMLCNGANFINGICVTVLKQEMQMTRLADKHILICI